MTSAEPAGVGPTGLDEGAVVGRRRRLLRLGGPTGVVAGIAIDHRDSLRVALAARGLASLSSDELRILKVRLVRALAPAATAVMLDAELGGLALATGAVPPSVALIMPLEAQGYEAGGDDRTTQLQADFTPSDAARVGADACKLLVPYRADREATADRQDAVVRRAAEACHAEGLPLVIEPVVYPRSTETGDAFAAAYAGLVLAAVTRLGPLGADLLKLPFPVAHPATVPEPAAAAACRSLDAACGGIPWVLLGAGADTAIFVDQVRLAGLAGASGFLAGRGIWGPALAAEPSEVERRASGRSRVDLERCREVAERFAQPLGATLVPSIAG